MAENLTFAILKFTSTNDRDHYLCGEILNFSVASILPRQTYFIDFMSGLDTYHEFFARRPAKIIRIPPAMPHDLGVIEDEADRLLTTNAETLWILACPMRLHALAFQRVEDRAVETQPTLFKRRVE